MLLNIPPGSNVDMAVVKENDLEDLKPRLSLLVACTDLTNFL